MARSSVHRPEAHKRAPVKVYCRVATTASVTIATALNSGDTIDGVVLATGDRVLVKDNTTENGIYVVAASPARAYDMDTAVEVIGALVYVIAGTTNGGKVFRCTNTSAVTLGVTTIAFTEVGATIAAGTYFLASDGGQGVLGVLANLGSTETIDVGNGLYQTGTLNANCTIDFTGWTNATYCEVSLRLTEDSTGGYTPTFTGVTWIGGGTTPEHTTTDNSVTDYIFWSTDGGTTIYGGQVGASTSTSSSTTAGGHVHAINEAQTGDGVNSTFYLAEYPDDNTVAAYMAGIRVDVTQVLDAVTFPGTPPIYASLRFDYIAETT